MVLSAMCDPKRCLFLPVLCALGVTGTAGGQVLLQLQGQPYFGGNMTLHLTATGSIGQPALMAFGLDPLSNPVQTGKGPFFIGTFLGTLPLGGVPASGRIDLPFVMPPEDASAVGIPLVLQGYVPGQLSNPATLPLDMPYFTASKAQVIGSPEPVAGALFGDRVAAGDLNGDGAQDLIVGALFEDWAGFTNSGRAYVLWGPDLASYVALSSPAPAKFSGFGGGLAAADLDLDGFDDLLIGEIVNPDIASDTGTIYVYFGGLPFAGNPSLQIESPVAGLQAGNFGRQPTIGDFNGDSWPDIADGVSSAIVSGQAYAGKIAVYWGPTYATHAILTSPAPEYGDVFGRFLAVGDVNADGIADLVAGSGGDDVTGVLNQGSVQVFVGPALALHASIPNPYPGVPFVWFGDYLHAADLTGDGLADIATRDDLDRVFVFLAPDFSSFIEIPKPPSEDVNPELGFFGYMLGSGDANGDGRRDLFIGDPPEGAESGCAEEATGTMFVSLAPYFETFCRIHDVPGSCGNFFADTGSTTANLDQDGLPELIGVAPVADDGGLQNSGHVTIFDDGPSGP